MNSILLKTFLAGAIGVMAAVTVASQTSAPDKQVQAAQTAPVQLDESFDLDIKERRITEKNYKAAEAVAVGSDDSKSVRVQVGVALSAQSIDVRLRNVSGSVRFRGTLQRLVDLIKSHPPR